MEENNNTIRYVDVEEILKAKAPGLYKKLPRFVIRYLIKIFHQDEINSDLQKISGESGVPKFHKQLEISNIKINLHGKERIPRDGRFIFAANHPMGGPEGIVIVSAVGRMFPKTKLMVNDLLMNLPDIEDVFVPINRFGRNKHEYVNILDDCLQSDSQLIIFPAGLVSRKIKGKVEDLAWKKSFISYAKRFQRDVVPVYIDGKNSKFFYRLANWRTRLGIKTNIEQMYLIDEFYKHKNKDMSVYFGEPIPYQRFTEEKTDKEWAEEVKQIVYSLEKNSMEPVIEPVDRALIMNELTGEKLLRKTRHGSNEIYVVNGNEAPNVMREIGRLRELAFRQAGGGTGKSLDIDEFDVHPSHPYMQIVIWNPESQQILGGYRYILCSNARNEQGEFDLATSDLFHFSDKFKTEYMPDTIELGRSFVYHESSLGNSARKSVFVLDNLWEGIGAVLAQNPQIKYLFGKVTMYLKYDKLARDYVLYFMNKYFADHENLVTPIAPLSYNFPESVVSQVFSGKSFRNDYRILSLQVRKRKCNIPPLINSYINLSETMKVFGTSLNTEFGAVEETGILVTINDITSEKLKRYIMSYQP